MSRRFLAIWLVVVVAHLTVAVYTLANYQPWPSKIRCAALTPESSAAARTLCARRST